MSEPPSHFEQLSFWELLDRHAVQIPVIQRDYAQGRQSKVKVLTGFLDALNTAVNGNPIELDFIYGDVKNGVFRPLDGQQRLTTLFLLHWYAARKARLSLDAYATVLSKFSYDTRISSRDFCLKLVEEPIEIDGAPEQTSLSQRIKDYPWFVGTWDFDPTVAGMLAALDRISTLNWPEDLWNRLTLVEVSPIRFVLVKLEKFGLSDDLYIKMNARGKPLTVFENFKAGLGELVIGKNWDRDLSTEDSFAIRVDTRWTDFFWRLVPADQSGLKRIDEAFLAFIAHSLACSIASHTATAEEVADILQNILTDPEAMAPVDFTAPYYLELREHLEQLAGKSRAIRDEAREKWEFSDTSTTSKTSFLEEVIQTPTPQYRRRLILYAQLKLHEAKVSISDENMEDWRQVVRNVIAHSVAERAEDFVAGIRLLDELSAGIDSIYDFLANTKVHSRFARRQVDEEQRKARLLHHNPEQKALLHRLENTYFLRGRIAFALDCVDKDKNPKEFNFDRLADIAAVIEQELGKGITPEIRRAFFTIGDGNFFHYWNSWFYTKNLPKYCLISDDNDFRRFTDEGHPSRDRLIAFVQALIGKSCQQLLADYQPSLDTPNWRVRLIREDGLIQRATHHYIALDKDNAVVYPINGIRPHNNGSTHQYLEENKIQ